MLAIKAKLTVSAYCPTNGFMSKTTRAITTTIPFPLPPEPLSWFVTSRYSPSEHMKKIKLNRPYAMHLSLAFVKVTPKILVLIGILSL